MYGIPNMKLDKHLVERRIKLLEEAGVTFELNSEIGHKISSETLLKQFDAIALCTGSTVPRDLTIPGRELQGIHFAKDYLHSVTKSFLDSSLQDKKSCFRQGERRYRHRRRRYRHRLCSDSHSSGLQKRKTDRDHALPAPFPYCR